MVTVVDAEDATVVHAATEWDPITLFGVRLHLLPAGCLFDFAHADPGHRARARPVLTPEGTRCAATDLRHLGGPNVFTASPVSVARLELDELTGRETTDFPGFAERLTRLLPGLASHHCAAGRPGGFLAAMARGTYFGHVTEHVALELSAWPAARSASAGRCGRAPTVATT